MRARPVADAPAAALLDRCEELARRWAIALILESSLAEMAEVPLEDLAREAPGVCAQVVRALDSEAELERIAASEGSRGRAGAAPTVRLGALDARATVEHIEALRGVIWEAALAESTTRRRGRSPISRTVSRSSARRCSPQRSARARRKGASETSRQAPAQDRGQVLFTAPQPAPGRRGAALIDEFEDAVAPRQPQTRQAERGASAGRHSQAASLGPSDAPVRSGGSGAARTTPRPLPWDTPLQPAGTPRRPSDRRASAERRDAEDAEEVVRITRGPGSPIDERS